MIKGIHRWCSTFTGGYTYYKDAIVLDMNSFNKILAIDEKKKEVTVEAGATISAIQQAIAKKGLAMKVSQSLLFFSVGGSLSVNGHGRDIRHGSMASTVSKMTVITPTGELKTLEKNNKAQHEQMKTILGGYGLFGVIVEVTFELVDDEVY
ncbi:MAG: FAD-binding oxidoreductase [Kurthia sp.]|nr:FAD-binding oxidoreductase [Candidatus Kurthia equi]